MDWSRPPPHSRTLCMRCCLSSRGIQPDFSKNSPRRRGTTISVTENSWPFKFALEEWRHWFQGTQQPFTVLTDHKNLEYLRDAKRLTPHQARWALVLPISISPFLIVQVPKMSKQMLSPVFMPQRRSQTNLSPSCLPT